MGYTRNDLLCVAKRFNNQKRGYLLVNPLQGKHLPVNPGVALNMMRELGRKLAAVCGEARLVIAFAETATAIGAEVAAELSPEGAYITTTREPLPEGSYLKFSEEHSHAVEQRLSVARLAEWLNKTPTVILLDDELSTGRTLRNMAQKLRTVFPRLKEKKLVAASIINRLTEENRRALTQEGIETVSLLTMPSEDYERALATISVREALPPPPLSGEWQSISSAHPLPDFRQGIVIGEYAAACQRLSEEIYASRQPVAAGKILVLGTEECMWPALRFGQYLTAKVPKAQIFCHATTRSPIGLSEASDYPITSGYLLPGFYAASRHTYIYNLAAYDQVYILTDAHPPNKEAMAALAAALNENNCRQIHLWEV
ncbi:MAG: phosphoribosyltransferase domain-containing protein [Selenomonadaceae bacterium]|nr:phosphoribosyltransferase domain-containing protein [Selenomonadaceae bacterium]